MEAALVTIAKDHGIVILLLPAMLYLFYKVVRMHKTERSEWREDFRHMFDRSDETQRETNRVVSDLTHALRRDDNG